MADLDSTATQPIPRSLRMDFASAMRTYSVALEHDLFGQWIVTRSWGGKRNNMRGSRVTHAPSFEVGLAMVRAAAKRREKYGYQLLA